MVVKRRLDLDFSKRKMVKNIAIENPRFSSKKF